MSDIFTKKKRSDVMSRIRSAGNKGTELRLIQVFRAYGITGWRRGRSLSMGSGVRRLAAWMRFQSPKNPVPKTRTPRRIRSTGRVKPDFVFPSLRVAVFVDGCFWHGCPKHGTQPKTRAAFWLAKLTGNKARDRRVNRALRERGWSVMRIWEHELAKKNLSKLLKRLGSFHLPVNSADQ